jgi:cation diffusion facilitator family transporter
MSVLSAGGHGYEPDHRKARAARVSIVSNTGLIALKVVAGVLTGSVAIITEAVHSAVDLVASVVAWFSVRKAEEPADRSHPYGHEKVENLAAALEGVLIVLGAAIIIYEAINKLSSGAHIERLGIGIGVIAFSAAVNFGISRYLYRQAKLTDSPALEGDAAHLRTDAITSIGVLVALALVAITGVRLVSRSSRVLVDEALPEEELERIAAAINGYGAPEVIGYHKLRARRAGSRRYIDLHVQFAPGTTLERAHQLSHELQGAIGSKVGGADVLIHLEPADALEPREPGPLDAPRAPAT